MAAADIVTSDSVWRRKTSATRESQIIGLDIIRFGAAGMVMLFHLAYWSWAPGLSMTKDMTGPISGLSVLAPVAWLGWTGVEAFFVISGFVIFYSAAGSSATSFLRGRILRLYPAAWICATATLLTLLLRGRADADTAAAYARTLVLWIQGPWIDGVYWTLAIEIVFYGVVFLALGLAGSGSLRFVIGILALVSSAFWIGLGLAKIWPHALPREFVDGALTSPVCSLLLLRHGCFFALGAILWIAQSARLTAWWIFLFALCLVGGMLEVAAASRIIAEPIGDTALRRATAVGVWLVATAAVAVSVRYREAFWSGLRRWAGTIKVLGLMTYPLYLLHDITGASLLSLFYNADLPPLVALGLAMLAVVGVSWIVTVYLEPSVKAWLRARLENTVLGTLERKRPAPAVPPNPSPRPGNRCLPSSRQGSAVPQFSRAVGNRGSETAGD